jgi:hypothetical protein
MNTSTDANMNMKITENAGSQPGTQSASPQTQSQPKIKPLNVIFCIPGKSVSMEFLQSWSQLLSDCVKKNVNIVLSCQYDPVVHFARSKCLGANVLRGKYQLPFDGKIDYDYLMWIDSDMVFTSQDFFRMLETPHEVTCGTYMMRDNKHLAVVPEWDNQYFSEHGNFKFLTYDELNKYAEVSIDEETKRASVKNRYMKIAYSGMGWMLVKKGVFERINYPWFSHDIIEIGNSVEMCSEDVAFCRNVSKLGIPIYIDTTIRLGHLKKVILG